MKITPAAKRPEPVLTALRSAKDAPTRAALLRPLGAIIKGTGGSPQALETVKSALKDSDAQVRLAALRCLTDWPDASPAGLLLEVAQNEPDHRELALRGGARMAANVAAGRDSTKLDHLAWFTQANQLVRTTEEKLIIVSGLGSLRQIEGLRMLQPYLEDPAVATEAELAVVELSAALASTSHAGTVKGVLEKITATSKDADVRRKAGKAAKGIQPKKQK
jgi:HEAT repeat protein